MPEVSVVIPAYNAEETIAETLCSVLHQTFTEFEVIVVDDGSHDCTDEVARAFGDERIQVLSVPNGGVARARNHGMDAASGELIALLDADDLWAPEKLERQVATLREGPYAGMCFASAVRIDGGGHRIGEIEATEYPDFTEALLLYATVISGSCSSAMFRRRLLEQVGGFDPAFSQSADWDFWLRLSRHAAFAVVPEPLVMYRTYAGQMSSDISLLERDTFAVLDKLLVRPDFAFYLPIEARVRSNHWMICSGSYLHQGKVIQAGRCLMRGLQAYPANVRRPLGFPGRWIKRLARRLGASA